MQAVPCLPEVAILAVFVEAPGRRCRLCLHQLVAWGVACGNPSLGALSSMHIVLNFRRLPDNRKSLFSPVVGGFIPLSGTKASKRDWDKAHGHTWDQRKPGAKRSILDASANVEDQAGALALAPSRTEVSHDRRTPGELWGCHLGPSSICESLSSHIPVTCRCLRETYAKHNHEEEREHP